MGKLNRCGLTLISSVTLLVGISACGNNPATEADIDFPRALEQASGERDVLEPALAGTIIIDGSSTVFPVTTVMAKTFQKIHPDVHFMIGVSGTGGGFKKFCVGETLLARPALSMPQKSNCAKPITSTILSCLSPSIACPLSSIHKIPWSIA